MEQFGTEAVCDKLRECVQHNDWETFIKISISRPEVLAVAFTVFDSVPDKLKYQFAIEAYSNNGDSIPGVRKAVRSLQNYPKPKLPEFISSQNTITVFRAGEEPIHKSPYRLSWTTDKRVAEFFLNEYVKKHARHLFKANIHTADIIAYTNDREEQEVLQYRKVFNVEEITPNK